MKENIVKLRKLTGITQQELGKIADVSRSAVSLWEMGDSEPRMGAVQNIADYFGIKKANIIEDGGMDNIAVSMSGRLYEMGDNNIHLTDDERVLIAQYRRLDEERRAALITIARSLQ